MSWADPKDWYQACPTTLLYYFSKQQNHNSKYVL